MNVRGHPGKVAGVFFLVAMLLMAGAVCSVEAFNMQMQTTGNSTALVEDGAILGPHMGQLQGAQGSSGSSMAKLTAMAKANWGGCYVLKMPVQASDGQALIFAANSVVANKAHRTMSGSPFLAGTIITEESNAVFANDRTTTMVPSSEATRARRLLGGMGNSSFTFNHPAILAT